MGHGREAEQAGWSLCALLVVLWGLQLWTGSTQLHWLNPVAVALVLVGLLGFTWVWVGRLGRPQQAALMALLAAAVCVWGYLQVYRQPAYGTDEIAFDQQAATLFLHGANPYTHSLLPALDHFLVPPIYHTYLLDGTAVSRLSYPPLSFLLYLPALALGLHMQAAVFTDLVAWTLAFLLLWTLLPRRIGWVAGVLMTFTMYANFVVGGVTDALFLPFVFLALWRWDRFGAAGERGTWAGPVALGLALSIKQTPWFLLPFLLVALAHEGRAAGEGPLRRPLRYAALALAPFAAIDLPFAVRDAHAWVHGVLTPLTSPTVASGQGIVNLALFEHRGGQLHYYTLAGAAALLTALVAFALHYRLLKRAWVPLVSLVFFWPTRSFASYLIDLAPAAVLAATTTRPAPALLPRRPLRLPRIVAVAVPGGAFVAAIAFALASAPPLRVRIVDTRSTGQLATIDRIDVSVHNTSAAPLRPHFTLVKGGYLTTFWPAVDPQGDPISPLVPAHATRVLTLQAPNAASMPSLDGGYVLEAFTSTPATVSSSRLVPPTPARLVLLPAAVRAPVPVGKALTVTVRLVDRLGSPIHHAGIPVALGQIVYGERDLVPAEASINGAAEGRTPVESTTDADGVARFSVRGIQPQHDPVFLQAWITPRRTTPYGYSNPLTVQLVPARRRSPLHRS